MTKAEYSKYAKVARDVVESNLGFAPSLNKIVLLETGFDGLRIDYVLFEIKGVENINYRVSYSYGSGYAFDIIKVNVKDDYRFEKEINL